MGAGARRPNHLDSNIATAPQSSLRKVAGFPGIYAAMPSSPQTGWIGRGGRVMLDYRRATALFGMAGGAVAAIL
jgi:hypothetical protein